jgi:hypothetical protein
MRDSNFLQDALRAAATEPLDTCTLCGAIINRPYEDAHNHWGPCVRGDRAGLAGLLQDR